MSAEQVMRMVSSAPDTLPAQHQQLLGDSVNCTDLGNARRLVRVQGDNIRYCWPLATWFEWDDARWRRDPGGRIFELARDVIREVRREAEDAHAYSGRLLAELHDLRERGVPEDGDVYLEAQKAYAKSQEQVSVLNKWAMTSEGERRLKAAVELAKSEPGISVEPGGLDADPWLLNCRNGTVDLRTAELRPHRRSDLITKLAPVDHDPEAQHALWERFLAEALPDAATRAFVQRLMGYCLAGVTSEDIFAFLHGPGGTGKSTIKEAVLAAVGDYGQAADFEAFTARRHTGGPRPEIAGMVGARLVAASETEGNQKLAAALVKQLAGGDRMATRGLYQSTFEFTPQFTIIICANERPRIPDDDSGIWRRLREVPFTTVFAKPDPGVRAQLRDPSVAGSAILAWLVEGCVAWQRDGLGTAPQVEAATAEYRTTMDPLGDFLSDTCVVGEDCRVPAGQLFEAYERWCDELRLKPPERLTKQGFGRRVGSRFASARSRTGKSYYGIGLAAEPERDGCGGFDGPIQKPLSFKNYPSPEGGLRIHPSQPPHPSQTPNQPTQHPAPSHPIGDDR
ncbi:MAG: hypothetical protein GEU80_10280 [Dehalococcoidia bacterium]|nr:hypothetical protein [Dehalococcoidia bacterium]